MKAGEPKSGDQTVAEVEGKLENWSPVNQPKIACRVTMSWLLVRSC